MAFPLSDYEQSLLHEYALHPPPNCPLDSTSAIQDLVCLRLIQSGQYAAAVKLDRQFALAATKTTPKVKKATEDRRRMMDEIVTAMPSAERNLLHVELEQLALAKPSSSTFSTGVSIDSSANDLSVSWEHIPPRTPRPVPNGRVPVSEIRTQQHPLFGESPMPERSAFRRFGLAETLSGRPGADTGLPEAAKAPPYTAYVSPMRQSTSHFSPLLDSSRFQSSSGPSGLRFTGTPTRLGPGPLAAHSSTPTGMTTLDNATTSANFTRNAFYEPPVTNGVKRPFGQDEPRLVSTNPTPPSPPPQSSAYDDDVDMHSEEDSGLHSDNPINGTESTEPAATPDLPFSIFTQTGKNTAPRQLKRSETRTKMPPGAFSTDSDEEGVAERTRRRKDRTRVSPPAQKTQPSRSSKSRKSAKEATVSRTIPGALIAEEEEDEEVDDVGPLPGSTQSKKPTRKGRSSRTNSIASDLGESKAPRRSSRLMNAPSTASSSPEPPPRKAPAQGKKTSRASAAASATTSKSGSRKKR